MNYQSSAKCNLADVDDTLVTCHAELRMAQRNLSLDDIYFVLDYGQRSHRAGAIIFYLRKRDIPKGKRALKAFSRLEGTTVVVSREHDHILTVYRNRQKGMRNIRKKPRHGFNLLTKPELRRTKDV